MRIVFFILTVFLIIGKANGQVDMRTGKEFVKHRYYKLLGKDSLQISMTRSEDLELLPPLDSIVKLFMFDYQRNIDTSKAEITARRIEYYGISHRAFVYFAPILYNEYQFEAGKVYTIKYGNDTVSLQGKLSNGRPYRVRFMVGFMKDMYKYGTGNVEALIAKNNGKPGELRSREGTK